MEILREIIFVAAATTTILAAALAAATGLRRRSASLRSRILASAFLLGLVLPATLPLLPSPQASAAVPVPGPAAAAGPAPETAMPVPATPVTTGEKVPGDLDPALLLTAMAGVWLAGVAVCGLRLASAHRQARRLIGGARTLVDGPVAALFTRLVAESADIPPVQLRYADGTPTPLTIGWRRPLVVLPAAAGNWPAEELAAVLRHELAHVRRRDNAVALAAGLLVCVHWFNPVAWWALHCWRRETEAACDDAVVRRGVRPSTYARVLLERAMPAPATPVPAAAAAPFAAHVRRRLHGLLDAGTDRSTSRRRAGFVTAAALFMLVLPLTGLRPAVQADPLVPEPAAREVAQPTGPRWWREMQSEMGEMRALNAWRRDPSVGTSLPEGAFAGDGWVLETHDAVVLPGAKYGCVFTSDEGYARVTWADGGAFALGAFPHPPLGKLERMLDRLLVPFDLDTDGEPRGYRIDGRRTEARLDCFREIVQLAAQRAGSETP